MGTDANCLSADVSAEGLLVAAGYANGSIRLWSSSGDTFAPKLPHAAGVVLVGFLPEARHVLSVDAEGVVRVWDLTPAVPPVQVSRPFTWIGSFSPDGRRIVLGTGSTSFPSLGYATVVDAVTFETLVPPLRHGGNVRSAAFSADGRLIATASDDGSARLWDAATGEAVSGPLKDSRQVKEVVLSPDGQRLLTLGFAADVEARPASLWDVSSGRVLATVPEVGSPYIGKFSPDAKHFLTVTRNPNRVQVWRSIDGQPVTGADSAGFTTAAFLSDSRVAMVGPDSVEVRSLDGTVVLRHSAGVRDADELLVTADRSTLLVSDAGGAIHVWSATDEIARRFPPWRLPGAITSAVSPDNRWAVGGSWERRAQVWSLQTGEPLTPMRALSRLPFGASFSPDGSRVQLSGRDATVWDLRSDPRSAGLLERISQLLSGHELVATQLVPLPVDRLLDLARDRALAQSLATADDRNWRWMAANQHLTQRNWAAAETELSTLSKDPEAIWEVRAAHGHALAELGRWNDAARAFKSALHRRQDSTELMYYEAVARASAGDDERDRRTRAPQGSRGTARRRIPIARTGWPASACCPPQRTRPRESVSPGWRAWPPMSSLISSVSSACTPPRCFARRNRARAAAVLEEVLKRPAVRDRGAETLLVLSLTHRTLGQVSASARTLGRFDSSPLRAAMPWYRRFEADTWRRELNLPR